MKTKRIILLLAAIATLPCAVSAQNFRGGYFLDGYLYAYKLNPAFSNGTDFISPMLGQSVTSVKSDLSLKQLIFPSPDGTGLVTGLHSSVDTETFLKPLRKKQNPLILEEDLNLFTYGFRRGAAYHIVDVSVRSGAAVNIPYDMFEFLKAGTSLRYDFDMKDLFLKSHTWLELSYGQSYDLSDRLTIGARVKGLVGMAYGSVHARTLDMTLSEEYWRVQSDVDMEFAGHAFAYELAKDKEGNELNKVNLSSLDIRPFGFIGANGIGLSADVGVRWQASERLALSAAILDAGGIKWFDGLYARTPEVDFRFDPAQVIGEQDKDNPANTLDSITLFIPQSKKKNSFDPMTVTFNAGAEYRMPFYDRMTVGLLGSYRLDNIFNWWEIRGSVNARPLGWLSLTANAGLSTYGMSYGAAACVTTGVLQFFLGTDAYVYEMTPQLIPLTKLNHNLVLGLAVPLAPRCTCDR
jgi:hypothetical protein